MVPAALGTQTAASIVRPASFCGCIGWKPTYGALSMEGIHPLAPSLDTLGFFLRDLDLVAPLYGALSGTALQAPRLKPRMAFSRTETWDKAEPSTRAAIGKFAAPYPEVNLSAGLVEAQIAIMGAEAALSLAGEPQAQLSAKLRAFLDAGRAVTPEQLRTAHERARRGREEIERIFEQFDALITIAAAGEAPLGLDSTGDPLHSRIWTLLGTPCVSLPLLKGPAGLPLGVQVVGPRGRDDLLLAAARALIS